MRLAQISDLNDKYRVILSGPLMFLLVNSYVIPPTSAIEEGVAAEYRMTSFFTFSTEVQSILEVSHSYGPLVSDKFINVTETIRGPLNSSEWLTIDTSTGALVNGSSPDFEKDRLWSFWLVENLVEGSEMKILSGNVGKVVAKRQIEAVGMDINAWEVVWRGTDSLGNPQVHTIHYSESGFLLRGQFETGNWTSFLIELLETDHSFEPIEDRTEVSREQPQTSSSQRPAPDPSQRGEISGPQLISEPVNTETVTLSPLMLTVIVLVAVVGLGAVVALRSKKN